MGCVHFEMILLLVWLIHASPVRKKHHLDLQAPQTQGFSGVDLGFLDPICMRWELIDDARREVVVGVRGLAVDVVVWSVDSKVFLLQNLGSLERITYTKANIISKMTYHWIVPLIWPIKYLSNTFSGVFNCVPSLQNSLTQLLWM